MFEWKMPIGGKVVMWRPLKVGDHMDLDANYGRSDIAHMRKYAELAMRVLKIGDKDNVQVTDLRDWDEYDLLEFKSEVDSRELARAVSMSPQRGGGAVSLLEQAVEAAQLDLQKVASSLQRVVQAAKEAEQKTGPLA